MGTRSEQTAHQRHEDGKQAYKKMLNLTDLQEIANYNEIPLHMY